MADTDSELTEVTITRPNGTEEKTLIAGETVEISSSGPVGVEITAGVSEFWADRSTDPAELHELYLNQEKSRRDLADEFDVTPSTVGRWLDRAGINSQTDN
ncbi:MAG: helix-turn-helix domain protein [uncultured archaeon A07HR60]|jgi:hypothetical protein|nr:MAG: hypothetical protein J07HR59_00640 [Halorubrum sp. J07HR59]ESS12919.1 MAG: helix-turn-helix domain protein [uncultured archaeon A07HR60]